MAFTNSPLATYTRVSPNRNSPRNQPITKITIHHMAGVLSLEQFASIVMNPGRQMSANYAIGNDGRIGLFCPEQDRSWCSSSPWNDNRAITIEVSNSAYGDASGWPVSNAAYSSLIKLCVDICKRNGIKKLEFTGDRNGSLTFHYMFNATACLPIDRTEVLTPNGWRLLKDIKIGDTIATAHIDNLGLCFSEVENIVPVKSQDTYTTRDFEATSDHRVIYYNQAGRQYVGQYKDLYGKSGDIYIPNAGYFEGVGLPLSLMEIGFLAAVQADGHYMNDDGCKYGIEFHVSKERKITHIKKLISNLGHKYVETKQGDGTTKIRIYGKEIVMWCEEYLHNKQFTWDWINMNPSQAKYFLDVVLLFDGCKVNKSYSSFNKENIDIVQAIASLNGIGSKLDTNGKRVYFKKPMRSLGDNIRKRNPRQKVSCVTVRSGFFLIRQHGRTTITGNCPGPWIKARAQEICDKVNAQLNTGVTAAPTEIKPATPVSIKAGDLVKLSSGAVYYGGGNIPAWVKQDEWYVDSVSGDRAVLGFNKAKISNIKSPISTKYLTATTGTQTSTTEVKVSITKSFKSSDILFNGPNGSAIGTVGTDGVYTIVEQKTVGGVTFGKLKSGVGWVIINGNKNIKKGDKVKVLNPIQYGTNNTFKTYVDTYFVLDVNTDRVVISSDGKNVTAAINKNNLQKI